MKFIPQKKHFSGTAANYPIVSLDDRIIGTGKRGGVTKKLQDFFFEIVNGNSKSYKKWLTHVK